MKDLIDVLLPPGEPRRITRGGKVKLVLPHPCGLSIVADDNPRCLELVPIGRRVRTRAEQGTTVTIEELPPAPAAPGGGDMSGFYLMHRGWMENPALANGAFDRRSAWCWLVERAAWQDTRQDVQGRTVVIRRGQLCTSYRHLAEQWGWSIGAVQRFLARLQTDTMVDTAADTGRVVITICNYEKYQAARRETDTPVDTLGDTPAIHKRIKGTRRFISPSGRCAAGGRQGALILPLPGTAPAPDPAEAPDQAIRRQLWAEGRRILGALRPGLTPDRTGVLLGQWAKDLGGNHAAVLHVLRDAEMAACAGRLLGDPIRWVWGAVRERAGRNAARRPAGEATAMDRLREMEAEERLA